MNSPKQHIVTRFAPSPTGFMHIGSVRTALFSYLFAKGNQGTFILRIEDTDKKREVEGSIQHIIDSLSWLGLDWDYGPDRPGEFGSCLQSERLEIYRTYAEKLIAQGLAYPDPYTTDELESFRAQAENENRPFLYRHHRPETFAEWDGTTALRLKVPEVKRYEWNDVVRGTLTAGEEMLDDIILIKADGFPTYNFAHIVDDLEMGVTHVMRGEEFVSSTPKFLSMYEALGETPPQFVTLPPILGPDGKKKLSKRDGAKDLLDYKKDGYLPEALRNFLALIGWNPGGDQELYPTAELVDKFSLAKIQKSGGAFNEEKLKWMNKEYLKKLEPEAKIAYVQDAGVPFASCAGAHGEERQLVLAETILERASNLQEIRDSLDSGEFDWLHDSIKYDTALIKWKNDVSPTDALPRLQNTRTILETIEFRSPKTIKEALWDYASEEGRGEVLWPLRVALSGQEKSPDPFTLAFILGPEKTLMRIQNACDKLSE